MCGWSQPLPFSCAMGWARVVPSSRLLLIIFLTTAVSLAEEREREKSAVFCAFAGDGGRVCDVVRDPLGGSASPVL